MSSISPTKHKSNPIDDLSWFNSSFSKTNPTEIPMSRILTDVNTNTQFQKRKSMENINPKGMKSILNNDSKSNRIHTMQDIFEYNISGKKDLYEITKQKSHDIDMQTPKNHNNSRLAYHLQSNQENYQIDSVEDLISELERIKSKNIFLENKLNEYIEKVASLEHQNLQLNNKKGESMKCNNQVNGFLNENSFIKLMEKSSMAAKQCQNRMQDISIEKFELEENIEFINNKLDTLQNSYSLMKQHVQLTSSKYEDILDKLNSDEDDKAKYIAHAKRLEEQLKNANMNLVNLNKKCSNLEKENKDMAEQLRNLEQEKRNYINKWNKVSNKHKSDDKIKDLLRNLESELSNKDKEIEDLREKYINTKTELLVLKQTENTYKDLIETKNGVIKKLKMQLESNEKEKVLMLSQNTGLIGKGDGYQAEKKPIIENKPNPENKPNGENRPKLENKPNTNCDMNFESIKSYSQDEIKKENVAAIDMAILENDQTNLSKDRNDSVSKTGNMGKRAHQCTKDYDNSRDAFQVELYKMKRQYGLLKKDYETLNQEYTKLLSEKQNEDNLIEVLRKRNKMENETLSEAINSKILQDENYLRLNESLANHEEAFIFFKEFVQNVSKYCENNDLQKKYERLASKYIKATERLKEFECNPVKPLGNIVKLGKENRKRSISHEHTRQYHSVVENPMLPREKTRIPFQTRSFEYQPPSMNNSIFCQESSSEQIQGNKLGVDTKSVIIEIDNHGLDGLKRECGLNYKENSNGKSFQSLSNIQANSPNKKLIDTSNLHASWDDKYLMNPIHFNYSANDEFKQNSLISDKDLHSLTMGFGRESNNQSLMIGQDYSSIIKKPLDYDKKERMLEHSVKMALKDISTNSDKVKKEGIMKGSGLKLVSLTYARLHQRRNHAQVG